MVNVSPQPLDPHDDEGADCPVCAWERQMLEEGKIQRVPGIPGAVSMPPEVEEEMHRVITSAGGFVVSGPDSALNEFTRAFEETMAMFRPSLGKKRGRNEPCFCGSGRKFKRCHGRAA